MLEKTKGKKEQKRQGESQQKRMGERQSIVQKGVRAIDPRKASARNGEMLRKTGVRTPGLSADQCVLCDILWGWLKEIQKGQGPPNREILVAQPFCGDLQRTIAATPSPTPQQRSYRNSRALQGRGALQFLGRKKRGEGGTGPKPKKSLKEREIYYPKQTKIAKVCSFLFAFFLHLRLFSSEKFGRGCGGCRAIGSVA